LGLIIIASIAFGLAILLGIEFIRFLLSDLYQSGAGGYQPGRFAAFSLRHRRAALVVASLWMSCWILLSLLTMFEFFTHSESYF